MTLPFRVAALGDAFTDRSEEVERVFETIESRGRLVVYGERRLGKTALIRRAAERARRKGHTPIYLDLWGAASEGDVLRKLFGQLPRSWLTGERLARVLEGFAGMITLTSDPSGIPQITLSPGPALRGDGDFIEVVEALDRFASNHGETVCLLLDEFQKSTDRLGLDAGTLRSLAQDCPNLGFVFSGSAVGAITALLDPDGPFLGYPTLAVGPIESAHLARWIRSVLEQAGRSVSGEAAASIVRTCNGITSYVLELANRCWATTSDGGSIEESTVEEAFAEEALARGSQYELLWESVVATDRAVLAAAAWRAQQITSEGTRRRFRLGPPSTVVSAIHRLRADAFLRPQKAAEVADPFFGEWIRRMNPEPPEG